MRLTAIVATALLALGVAHANPTPGDKQPDKSKSGAAAKRKGKAVPGNKDKKAAKPKAQPDAKAEADATGKPSAKTDAKGKAEAKTGAKTEAKGAADAKSGAEDTKGAAKNAGDASKEDSEAGDGKTPAEDTAAAGDDAEAPAKPTYDVDSISADGGRIDGATILQEDGFAEEPKNPPTPAELAQGKKIYNEGIAAYAKEDYKSAITKFKDAYRVTRNTLILYNIAITLDELNKKQRALFYFEKYVAEAPEDAEYKFEAKRRARLLRRELRADVLEENNYKPTVDKFMHSIIDQAPPRQPIDVGVMVPNKSDWRVVLFYRGPGDQKYTSTPMRKRYNELVGRIPKTKTRGSSVQYYIEVHTAKGKRIDGSGKSASPNVVFIEKGAKSVFYPDFAQNPVKKKKRPVIVEPGDGMWDAGSTKFEYFKWSTTGISVAALGLSVTSYILASNAKRELEQNVIDGQEGCPVAPCRVYSGEQRALQSRGKRFTTMYQVSLGIGIGTAALAGYLWYKDIKGERRTQRGKRMVVSPVATDTFVGGAAVWEW